MKFLKNKDDSHFAQKHSYPSCSTLNKYYIHSRCHFWPLVQATYLGNLMGQKALAILEGQGAKLSPSATKVLSRIEALRGAAKAGVLSSDEAGRT